MCVAIMATSADELLGLDPLIAGVRERSLTLGSNARGEVNVVLDGMKIGAASRHEERPNHRTRECLRAR